MPLYPPAPATHAEDHDHDGSPTQQLTQANSHQSPDTDTGASSLHHTIGSGANQAAAGNHSHTGGQAFPVGSVFIAVVSTSPATLLGYGTWAAFATGRMLVGLDSGDTDFDTVEETGGAKTHTHAGHSNHSVTQPSDHASHTHTYTQVPNHVHVQNLPSSQTGSQASGTRDASTTGSTADALSTANPTGGVATGTTAGPGATITHSGAAVDAHSAHDTPSNVPPYIVVYMWKRTA